ncbi:hypothetical protein [Thermocrinis minervae]|nr:hypothetical protein [Thermocrinis minervae]
MKSKLLASSLFVLSLLLNNDDEPVPLYFSPDLKLSYDLDQRSSINVGISSPDDIERVTNKDKVFNKYILWFSIRF